MIFSRSQTLFRCNCRKMGALLFLTTVLLVSGCASTPSKQYSSFWVKDGFTYENAVTIEAACRHEAINAVLSSNQEISVAGYEETLVKNCMIAKDFRWGKYEK